MNDKRVLIVAPTEAQARRTRDLLGYTTNPMTGAVAVNVGSALGGYRFTHIILDGASDLLKEKGKEWYDFVLLCRLTPDGRIVRLPASPYQL